MSSEIYNYNYGKSIYNLKLNSLMFSSSQGKLWKKYGVDSFTRQPVEDVPRETRAKIFSNELIRLVENKNASPKMLKQAIKKYLPNTSVKIVSMEDYTEFGINTKKNVAAATRPKYDKSGKLISLEIYIPSVVYGDKISENKFIENITHEITHAMQYAEDDVVRDECKNTPEGKFYNFFQQNVSGMLINTMVTEVLVHAAKAGNVEILSLEDYDKFLELENNHFDEKDIMAIHKYKDKEAFNNYLKVGFDVYLTELMNKTQVSRDPFALKVIKETGGLDAFKAKIMAMTAHTLQKEHEAYLAGCNARKGARDFVGNDYNDLIPQVVEMLAEALNS